MRILITGFLIFLCWSALSTYLYVCKIKGLCNDLQTTVNVIQSEKAVAVPDTFPAPVVIEIPEDLLIYFAFDKSDINSKAVIDTWLEKSNLYFVQNPQAKLNISGHTDATGTEKYNKALGFRRAKSVQDYFQIKGIPPEKIITDPKGENSPADNNRTKAGRANNRRAEISFK